MKILDLYIIKKFLGTFFFALGLLIAVTIVFDLSEKIDNFIDKGAPIKGIILDYYMNFIPFFANMFCYLIVFIAVIFFTSRMAAKTEFIAMFSSGISTKRLLLPYFISAIIISAFSFYLGNYVIPPANQKKIDFETKFIRRSNPTITSYNMHRQVFPNIYFFIEYYNKRDGEGVNITLEKFENSILLSKLSAESMKWDTVKNKWTLYSFTQRDFLGDTEKLIVGESIDTVFNLSPEDFIKSAKIIETMDLPELNKYIEDQKLMGTPDVINSLVEKHNRIASPFATFILTIIGFSLSIKKVRSGGLGLNIGIGLSLSFTYIFFMKFSSVLALNGGFNPILSSWLPNIIYAVIAIGIFLKIPE